MDFISDSGHQINKNPPNQPRTETCNGQIFFGSEPILSFFLFPSHRAQLSSAASVRVSASGTSAVFSSSVFFPADALRLFPVSSSSCGTTCARGDTGRSGAEPSPSSRSRCGKILGYTSFRSGTSTAISTGNTIAAGVSVTAKITTKQQNWYSVYREISGNGTASRYSAWLWRRSGWVTQKETRSANWFPGKEARPMYRNSPSRAARGIRPRIFSRGSASMIPMKSACIRLLTRCSCTWVTTSLVRPFSFTCRTSARDLVWSGAWGMRPLVGGMPSRPVRRMEMPTMKKSQW
mmetsp:Transcript_12728/g.18774  ORF Transcript_12728/g.18774 Transcript_12728/m.18774 type:complete len:292 (-) Transcript_12728:1088-1963(-)